LALSLSAAPSWATVIIDTDFSSASAGSITSNGAISGAGGLVGQANATDYLNIESINSSNALTFTKTTINSATQVPTVYKTFSGASTGAAGDNLVTGSFTLTRINNVSGQLSFFINSGSGTTSSAATTAVSLSLNNSDGKLAYNAGSSSVTTASGLSLNSVYQVNISLDMSSTTQDLWRLTVRDLSNGSALFLDTGWINTRAANVTPGILVWNAGANSNRYNASSFAAVDNIRFDLVPEPSAFGLAALGLGGLWIMHRRRQRANINA